MADTKAHSDDILDYLNPFSLRQPLCMVLVIMGVGIYILTFSMGNTDVGNISIAVVYNTYAFCVWGYYIYIIVEDESDRKVASRWVPFLELVLLYIFSLMHNSMLYSAVALADSTAFVGISTDVKWKVLYNSVFLSSQTVAALGTGSIFANPTVGFAVGFIPVWINSIQAILFSSFIVPGTIYRVHKITQRKDKKREDKALRHVFGRIVRDSISEYEGTGAVSVLEQQRGRPRERQSRGKTKNLAGGKHS